MHGAERFWASAIFPKNPCYGKRRLKAKKKKRRRGRGGTRWNAGGTRPYQSIATKNMSLKFRIENKEQLPVDFAQFYTRATSSTAKCIFLHRRCALGAPIQSKSKITNQKSEVPTPPPLKGQISRQIPSISVKIRQFPSNPDANAEERGVHAASPLDFPGASG